MNVQMDVSLAVGVERLFRLLEREVRRTAGSGRAHDRIDHHPFAVCAVCTKLA